MNKKTLPLAVASSLLATTAYAETNNWEASVILEGLYVDKNEGEAEIHGMPSGGHNHGFEKGLNPGHNEIVFSGNLSEKLSAKLTTAMSKAPEEEGGGLELELEEAFIETRGLGGGFNAKAGRFYTDMGYHSSKHNHEWDFADQPLIYEGMFGTHPISDGLQLSFIAPTDTFLKVGAELFTNEDFPAGETESAIKASTIYAKVGGDIGTNHSWLAGIGHWQANDIIRESEAHGHEEEHGDEDHEEHAETPRFTGDSSITTIGGIYKWAPNGNSKERNFKFQVEYFQRNEDGSIDMVEEDGNIAETSSYDGDQSGWYAQAVYQFMPHWRLGLRHDRLSIDNTGSDEDVLEEAELLSEGHTPKRNSLMLDYSPYEYSRLRLQFNRDERSEVDDNQVILQYTHSFGSHGAHAF